MEEPVFRRPDENAMRHLLEKNRQSCVGLILRLAWNMGLSSTEMHELKWDNVLLDEKLIRLPDRSVPIDEDTLECLMARYPRFSKRSPYIVISDRKRAHMHRVNISNAVHEALGTEELLQEVSLKDLREDFVIRQLGCQDSAYVAAISGLTLATLTTRYRQFFVSGESDREQTEAVLEEKLWKSVQREGPSPEGLAIWMSWQLGLQGTEIVSLRWDQVDFKEMCLHLPKRTVLFDEALGDLLRRAFLLRALEDKPYVLLTPRAKKPFTESGLYLSVRTVLIRDGISDLTLGDLTRKKKRVGEEELLLRYAKEQGAITRSAVEKRFGQTADQAYTVLKRLTEQGKLVRKGIKYYPVDIRSDEGAAVISNTLQAEGNGTGNRNVPFE